eukprot:TRINITY_DN1586_c0_g1_i5.p1 TRINITY_DN1586_c0_g1~~TRINITY_DN1586_c0_g1_i5.p1  ORF type:complete len:300 (-),score=33.60 TRINITY_DN1586_c0_g1_i5:923-1798(-)
MAAETAAWRLCGPCAASSPAAVMEGSGRPVADSTTRHTASFSPQSLSGHIAPNPSRSESQSQFQSGVPTSRWSSLLPFPAKRLSAVFRPSAKKTLDVRATDASSLASPSPSSSSPSSSSSSSSSSPPSSTSTSDYISPAMFVRPEVNIAMRKGAAPFFKNVVDVDHYGRLGCPPKALIDEIMGAYRERLDEVNADMTLDEATRTEKLALLKKSFDILTSDEKRRIYDWGLLIVSRPDDIYTWPCEADITQTTPSLNQPPKNSLDDDDPEGIRNVTFTGWFVLSLILGFFLH